LEAAVPLHGPGPARRRRVARVAAALALALAAVPAVASLPSALAASSAPVAAQGPGPPGVQVPGPRGGRVPVLRLPVRGPVVRGFEAPAGPYGAGHRGVDLGAPLGSPVGAPAAGRVVFAGPVAGAGWASVEVDPGVVVTVGPLAPVLVARGEVLDALDPVGRLAPGHGGGLHLGLRVDGVYVDPLPYLPGRGPARLAPLTAPGGR
jgi:murein DD-endopeptidase MepM/ murein hydrolase activator NlpD